MVCEGIPLQTPIVTREEQAYDKESGVRNRLGTSDRDNCFREKMENTNSNCSYFSLNSIIAIFNK